jgi:H+/Na+-translocating ferredoxin:NAD+ oxidoreductase subunit B
MVAAVITLGGIGLASAVALGLAAKKFAVETDPRELAVLDVLPGANCGACGYPGCSGYAKMVVSGDKLAAVCPPGGQEVMEKIANIMGFAPITTDPNVAVVCCQGDNARAKAKYNYIGIADCVAAQKIADGPKTCPGGCLGLGTCARICPFGAIEMTHDNLAVISREKCTGCGKCVASCPRQVIALAPLDATTHVLCNSHDKGAVIRKYCEIGCIGCQICKKTVPDAYEIDNFLAHVVYTHHLEAGPGIEKCPTKCIRDFADGYPAGSSFASPTCAMAPPKVA